MSDEHFTNAPRPMAGWRFVEVVRVGLRWLLAFAFVAIGVLHFVRPRPFEEIVPPFLPAPLALVYISGFFEALGGCGVLIPRLRRAAGWGLIALLIAVFPANIYMAVYNIQPGGSTVSPAAQWIRLPFQAVFIAWVWWCTLAGSQPGGGPVEKS
jgi:uncharacterized membrane protein